MEQEIQGKIGLTGKVKIDIYDKDGKLRETTGWLKNKITNAGLAVVAGLLGNTGSQVAFTYLAVGTSNTAESAAHTGLQAEITDTGLQRAAATVSRVTTTQSNDTLRLTKTMTATGTKAVEEVGVFNDASAGVMLGRKLTTTKTVNNGETLAITYDIQITGN